MSHALRVWDNLVSRFRRLIRVGGLRLLQATARDLRIEHHWVPGHYLTLNSFSHKGYWWHGRRRELKSLTSVASFLSPGQTALDVGAHIGYFAAYFAHLVGPHGNVIAFEPSEANLKYARANTSRLSQVQLDHRGISNARGEASFFVETLTGQNNSLLENYSVLESNAAQAGISFDTHELTIEVTTIDLVCREYKVQPAFIKVDVEGAELRVIQGMLETLRSTRPVVLLEISQDHHECYELFRSVGYLALDDSLNETAPEIFREDRPWRAPRNFFFVPR